MMLGTMVQSRSLFIITIVSFSISLVLGLGTVAFAEVVWDPASVVLESHKVGEGVYAVVPKGAAAANAKGYPVATSGGFVVGDEAVLVVESMMTKALANQVMTLVKAVIDKPIRYVVNTSYHGDHSYGNNAFPETTLIIQHPNTQAYIMNPAMFKYDKAFMMKNFGNMLE